MCRAAAPTAVTAATAAASGAPDRNVNTLIDYRFARIHRAGNGVKGMARTATAATRADVERACRWAP